MMAKATLRTNRGKATSAEDEQNKYRFGKTFPEITRADTFVDKTFIIPRVTKKKCIVAPRGFGKSVNLDMIKCFFEIQCDKVTGEQISWDDERSNYKLFEGLNIMQPEHDDFAEHNFGTFAVLKVDFLCCDSVDNVEEAVNFLKKVIHNTFKEYQYLQRSDRSAGNGRPLCTKWYSENYHSVVDTEDIKVGLGFLAQLLYEYFLTKVFVLIDDYDSLIMKIWLNSKITCQDYDYIKSLYCDVLSSVLSSKMVEHKVVTGIWGRIEGQLVMDFKGRKKVDHNLVTEIWDSIGLFGYYSPKYWKHICAFTSDEVMKLFKKFNLTKEQKCIAKEMCGGYPSRGSDCVYHPYSIVKYLSNDLQGSWTSTNTAYSFKDAFKDNEIRGMLYKLLDSEAEIDGMLRESYVQYKCVCRNNKSVSSHGSRPVHGELLNLLREQGYLVDRPDGAYPSLVIPNQEVRRAFIKELAEFYIENYKINDTKLHKCTSSFRNLLDCVGKSTEEFICAFDDFHEKQKDLISDVVVSNLDKVNNAILKQICFVPLFKSGIQLLFQDACKEKTTVTVNSYKKYVVELEITYGEGKNNIAHASERLKILMSYYHDYKDVIVINSIVNAQTKSFSAFACSKHNAF